jgi:hypothetical protein
MTEDTRKRERTKAVSQKVEHASATVRSCVKARQTLVNVLSSKLKELVGDLKSQ